MLASAEREKREKYGAASGDRRAIFTPLCVSVDGMMGREATKFVQHLADQLSHYNSVSQRISNKMAVR